MTSQVQFPPAEPATPPVCNPSLNTREAALYLGVGHKVLEQWRWLGVGPRFCKIGRCVRYRLQDLEAYLESRTFTSTTEAQARG